VKRTSGITGIIADCVTCGWHYEGQNPRTLLRDAKAAVLRLYDREE
jgi:hypothetical protein